MDRLGITAASVIPVDDAVMRYDLEQKPLFDLPDSSIAVEAVGQLMDMLLKSSNIQVKGG
jgi:CO dehydrogenase nickel-insertion accessory protein CooC1